MTNETGIVPTGIEGLDEVLHGGVPRGRLLLLQGATGTGKTTLALQFALAGVARGERVAYVSLAESQTEIANIAASHGWSVDGLSMFYQAPGDAAASVQTVLHPAEVELPAVLEAVLSEVERVRPARLVIDSLTELRVLARETRWYRHELMRLRARLETLGCTALLLDTAELAQGVESLLGGVLRLERGTPVYGPDRRRLQVVKMRGHDFETGYHDVRIRRGGLLVFPRLVAAQTRGGSSHGTLSTGLPELDAMLGGGLDRGAATLLLGVTGSGKSTLALQCALAAAQRGENVLAFVFDERLQTLVQRTRGLGMKLDRYMEAGVLHLAQVDPAELTPGEFADKVRRHVAEHDTRLLLLDSLNAYVYAMPDERLLNIHLHELFAFLAQVGVTSVLVGAQHGAATSVVLPSELDVSYLADAVVHLRIVHCQGRRTKALSVHKRRAGAHEHEVRELCFGAAGIRLGDVLPVVDDGACAQ